MSAALDYLKAVRGILMHLETRELPRLEKAADLIARSVAKGGAVYCGEMGHGIHGDFVARAGGLGVVQFFTYSLNLTDSTFEVHKRRPRSDKFDQEVETARLAVNASNMRRGDVLILASVSGRNKGPVEVALAARKQGIHVIGFTSMAYTKNMKSLHPSGKRLFEVVDLAIDNGVPYGDAAVNIPGYREKLMPLSGVAVDVAGWMIWGRVMEKMAAAGKKPVVFISLSRKGGAKAFQKNLKLLHKRGY